MATGNTSTSRLGPAAQDLLLNRIYRGIETAPPASLYWSLGNGTIELPVELPGSVRTEVICNRGQYGSTDSLGNFYQSSGGATATQNVIIRRPIIVSVPSGVAETTTTPFLMAWLAPSGGEPYYWQSTSWSGTSYSFGTGPIPSYTNLVSGLFAGDILRVGADNDGAYLTRRPFHANQTQIAPYIYSMYVDYLFRGIDSLAQFFSLSTFANVFMSFGWQNATRSIENYNTIPWHPFPRSTATWSAPADFNPGVTRQRFITNLETVTTSPATGPSWSSAGTTTPSYGMHIANTLQSFDETFYRWNPQTTNFLTYATGDQITFAPGQIQIVLW